VTIIAVVPVYPHRTRELHERLTRQGHSFDELDIDLAIESAVSSLRDESEHGGRPDPDNDYTWDRYIEPRVLDYLDVDPEEATVAHDRPAEIGGAL